MFNPNGGPMRVLRTTLFTSPGVPISTVVRDCDITDTLESLVTSLFTPGALMIYDIFQMADAEVPETTFAAMSRIDTERELNMAVLYFYDADMLVLTRADGLLTTSAPSPLSAEQIRYVLRQLAEHPNYEGQTVKVHDERGVEIVLSGGEVADD